MAYYRCEADPFTTLSLPSTCDAMFSHLIFNGNGRFPQGLSGDTVCTFFANALLPLVGMITAATSIRNVACRTTSFFIVLWGVLHNSKYIFDLMIYLN